MDKDLVNALFCALESLRGNAGGFSPHEKQNAIEKLQFLLAAEESKKEA